VIEGRGYCPLDDLRGLVIVEMTAAEHERLRAYRFDLPIAQ
jgi:hypothetical protein